MWRFACPPEPSCVYSYPQPKLPQCFGNPLLTECYTTPKFRMVSPPAVALLSTHTSPLSHTVMLHTTVPGSAASLWVFPYRKQERLWKVQLPTAQKVRNISCIFLSARTPPHPTRYTLLPLWTVLFLLVTSNKQHGMWEQAMWDASAQSLNFLCFSKNC